MKTCEMLWFFIYDTQFLLKQCQFENILGAYFCLFSFLMHFISKQWIAIDLRLKGNQRYIWIGSKICSNKNSVLFEILRNSFFGRALLITLHYGKIESANEMNQRKSLFLGSDSIASKQSNRFAVSKRFRARGRRPNS